MTYPVRLLLPLCLIACVAFSSAERPSESRDRTQVDSNINIGPGEEVQEATCFGCSIRVRGKVDGDVTAFGGSIVLEDQGEIGGDTTAFGGGIRLGRDVTVSGDVTVFGGRIQRDPAATVGGDVTAMGGPGWILLIFVLPCVFLGLLIALIVVVIRRLLRPGVPVAA
jgi:hypothetical protein